MKNRAQSVLGGGLLWMVAAAALAAAPIETKKPDGTPNRAAWMAQGTFGMMTHYLITPKGSTPQERTADLNRIVDQFDLARYMKQFDETGAAGSFSRWGRERDTSPAGKTSSTAWKAASRPAVTCWARSARSCSPGASG